MSFPLTIKVSFVLLNFIFIISLKDRIIIIFLGLLGPIMLRVECHFLFVDFIFEFEYCKRVRLFNVYLGLFLNF